MKRLLTALLAIVAVAGFARAANAQYMYLDSNGNGIHDAGDRLNPNGTATTVDLYVRTNQNRDGSTAVCDTGDGPLSINNYTINLMAVGGVVTYSGFINRQPVMSTAIGELNPDGVRYKNSWAGATLLPPGQYRLCTLTITGMTGSPRIDIVDLVSGSLDYTGFGTFCSSLAFDNTYKLDGPNTQALLGGPGDFADWDGLGSAAPVDAPPVLVAVGNKTVDELSTLAFTATAFDPNPGAILTFTLDAGAPAGASINPSTGAFSWTPTEAQGPGTFPITMRVTNNASPSLSDSKTFTVTVREVNAAPVLAPIGNKIACGPGSPLTFTATATDADLPANNLTFSLDPGAPPGATINGSTGVFNWTPSAFGTFPVTIRVTDNGTPSSSDFEAILITVTAGANQPPILGAIGNKTVDELAPLAFTAVATDAFGPCSGDLLTFSLDAGAPAGAAINGSTGAFGWTPTEAQGPGSYAITIRVTDDGVPQLSDFETITVTVNEVNAAPILAPIGGKTATVGSLLAFTATATDPDLPANTLCFTLEAGQPPGATISCGTGAFTWTPSPGQEGLYAITVGVTDNGVPQLSDSETITVEVLPGSHAPTADAGGPYIGFAGAPISFDGSGSSDPDGEALTYAWNFGDGGTSGGSNPSHTYGLAGSYSVSLHVTDPGGLFGDDVTTASIQTSLPANVFFVGGFNYVLPQILGAYIRLEPIANNFHTTDVLLPSITLSYNGVTVPARCKTISGGDTNHNGVQELRVCFTQKDMKTLFASIGNGTTTVTATMAANLSNGGKINGDVSIRVVKFSFLGAGQLSSVSPNPLNPQAKLMFVTTAPGEASVQIFDVRGRMVRNLMQRQYLTPGVHEVTIDGRNEQGSRLSSGVYFYRVLTADGPIQGSISVVK